MCMNIGENNELATVKALMTMSLNGIFAEVFDLDPDDLSPDQQLVADLGMAPHQQDQLDDLVAEYFDGLRLAFSPAMTVGDVLNKVVNAQFAEVAAYL